MESNHFITDRNGVNYTVSSDDETGWNFDIWHGDEIVGYMNCVEQPPALLIRDFKLDDNVLVREILAARWWRKLLGRPRPVCNYRNRGLGTAMMELIAKVAKCAGFERLEGWVSEVDTKDNPGLPEWYRRRGFTVIAGPGEYPHQVAAIRKAL